MKRIFFLGLGMLLCVSSWAADSGTQSRRSMAAQVMTAPRSTASVNQINAMAMANVASSESATTDKSSVQANNNTLSDVSVSTEVDMREKEKAACINNNIGIGNTFVWASRYSNTNNYATMVEDVENPENNTCFVRVEVKSNDARVDVSDVPAKYYEWGKTIVCGSWADEDVLNQRILDAKKSGRTWATIGGVVGGAGIGVGAMELFGNELIGGKVEGQNNENLSEAEVLRSQLLAIKGTPDYNDFMALLRQLKAECDNWTGEGRPEECSAYDYDFLLNL